MDELELYRRAFRAISETDFEGATRATLEAMVEVTGADRGFILAPEPGSGGLVNLVRKVVRAGAFPEGGPSETIARQALESGQPVRLENALEEPDFRGRPSVLAISVLSVLAVPIVWEQEPQAVVYLDSIRVAGIFSEDAEDAARRLAVTVAPAIYNFRRLAEARAETADLQAQLDEQASGPAIFGDSPAFQKALDRALQAARSEAPILLLGESGTGKELFAEAIHRASPRARAPFSPINCGALPEATLEAELFGYRKGAFTGAVEDRQGRVEAASGGTLFLDEIGDMPPGVQVKLLRLLQSGEIQKLGAPRAEHVDVRVVAATHRDLKQLVREGTFRQDLYFRLKVVSVTIPPLRERGNDVLMLAELFARRFGRQSGKDIRGISGPVAEALLKHPFAGNVRELENAIRHAVVFASGRRLTTADLPPEIVEEGDDLGEMLPAATIPRDAEELKAARDHAAGRIERAFIRSLLERTRGNVAQAARVAGMNRSVLHEMLSRHGVSADDFRD